ncbi:MAG: tetratricopeptide repeat protein [Ferruginibacter sp.]|nr:tetratricopeptide repeat protein [Ferruginibacter sp.]
MKLILLFSFFISLFSCNHSSEQTNTKTTSHISDKETILKNAVAQFPDSIDILQNLIAYYTEGQNYDAALATITNAISKDSTNPDFWDIRSALSAEKGDTAQAIFSLQKAIDILPIPSYIISLGALYAEIKDPMALQLADALLQANKAKAEKEAYFIKGLYYSYTNEKEKAIAFFDKCLAINYTFMEAYVEKGIALYDLKKYTQASEVFEKSITIQNKFDKGYYYLGQCYEKLNRTQEAIESYQTALLIDANYIEAKDALSRLGVKM